MYLEPKKGTVELFRRLEIRKKGTINVLKAKESMKSNVRFPAVINKESRCAWCIQSVYCKMIGMVDVFSS